MMFKDCFSLKTLNILNFYDINIDKLNENKIFENCKSLKKKHIKINKKKKKKNDPQKNNKKVKNFKEVESDG